MPMWLLDAGPIVSYLDAGDRRSFRTYRIGRRKSFRLVLDK